MGDSRSTIRRAVAIPTLFGILLLPLLSKAQSTGDLQWGAPVDGLQMAISTIRDADDKFPVFQVALRNVGDKDTTLI